MLQYMWHSGSIWWICLEPNGEDIVRIFSGDMQVFGASLVVLQMESCQLELWHLLHALQSEAM